MITDKDDFRYQRSDGEGRDGNSSSNRKINIVKNADGGERKKRPRVGDSRSVNRVGSSNTSNSEDGGNSYSNNRRSSSGYSNNRSNGGGYRSNNSGGYGNNNSGGYGNSNGGGYNNNGNNRSYNNNNRGGNSFRGNNNNNRRFAQNENDPNATPRKTFSKKKVLVRPVKYKENVDPSTPLRLNKYLANAGVCSRREADNYITSGVVKVNGEIVSELGAKVTRGDYVTFNDQPVHIESKLYVVLNKPKNCVTTSDDPQNRKTVMDLVKNACTERIYPVGRLDRNTTGVLLLTNDGDLASKLMHPKFKKKKIYQVKLDKDVTIEDMQRIADGVELDDGEIHADSIAYVAEDVLDEIGIEIHSGRNRVVRRIFEKLGYQVMKLDRVYFAGLTKKNLPKGKWRYLTEKEVNMLRMGAYE